ncbi:aminotransferase class iv [Diplodia corticola]|uniref:Aminotransferase class iv n=1 Tax=Diplodia corticola TaxID=236234 RepID=A0A1J9QVN7_9PEZI|nr:aminotransferase class iv [Diplodia corticola]OJD33054.1 aminotransferase class iv [Diplodia corticola]
MAKPKDSAKAARVKKPYHIKKADLHLDEYIEEQNSKNPSLLLQRAVAHLRNSVQFKLYLVLQLVAVAVGYGQAMLIVGLLWAMITNTGKRREGELSAYSLFNKDVQA